jgi:hypothetical protein
MQKRRPWAPNGLAQESEFSKVGITTESRRLAIAIVGPKHENRSSDRNYDPAS